MNDWFIIANVWLVGGLLINSTYLKVFMTILGVIYFIISIIEDVFPGGLRGMRRRIEEECEEE